MNYVVLYGMKAYPNDVLISPLATINTLSIEGMDFTTTHDHDYTSGTEHFFDNMSYNAVVVNGYLSDESRNYLKIFRVTCNDITIING